MEVRVLSSAPRGRGQDIESERIAARIAGAHADIRANIAEELKQRETLPLITEQLEGRRTLLAKGLSTRAQVAALEERVVAIRRDIESKEAEIARTRAEITMLESERAQALEEFRSQAAAEKAEAESIVATRAESVRKAERRGLYQTLNAPVDGVINEIAVTHGRLLPGKDATVRLAYVYSMWAS